MTNAGQGPLVESSEAGETILRGVEAEQPEEKRDGGGEGSEGEAKGKAATASSDEGVNEDPNGGKECEADKGGAADGRGKLSGKRSVAEFVVALDVGGGSWLRHDFV